MIEIVCFYRSWWEAISLAGSCNNLTKAATEIPGLFFFLIKYKDSVTSLFLFHQSLLVSFPLGKNLSCRTSQHDPTTQYKKQAYVSIIWAGIIQTLLILLVLPYVYYLFKSYKRQSNISCFHPSCSHFSSMCSNRACDLKYCICMHM